MDRERESSIDRSMTEREREGGGGVLNYPSVTYQAGLC